MEKQFVVKSSVEEKVAPGGEYSNVVMLKDHKDSPEVIERKGTLTPQKGNPSLPQKVEK